MKGSSPDGQTVIGKISTILLAFLNGADYSFTELVAATGLPLSTTHRLITQLTASALLERTDGGDYRIGRGLRSIGRVRRAAASFEGVASLLLNDLAQALDLEVRLGVLSGPHVLFIEKHPGVRPASSFRRARTAPAHATAMGKVLLAFCPPPVLDRFLTGALAPHTPQTITSPAVLRRALAATRRSYVAVAWQEHEPDRGSLAVPVFDAAGHVVAALEVRVSNPRTELAVVRPALTVAGLRLTRELASVRPPAYPGERRQESGVG